MASAIDLLEGKGPLEKPSADVLVGREGLPKTEYDDLMASASEEHGVPYEVLYRNIRQESGFNPKAVSKTGARGIAQFIPSTAKAMGIKDPHDPKQAIPGAARYIKQLYDQFGDWKLAIAAYNAGPEAVKRAKGIPKIKETINHVKAVFPDDDKEPSYKDSEGASEGFRFKSAMSLLEKAKPEIQQPIAEPIVNAQETGVSPKEFYTRNAFSPFGVMHPAMSAKIGRQGFGPKPEGGWDELGRPLDAAGEPYVKEGIKQEKVAGPIAETLKGLTSMAANPIEVIKGGLDFALSIPGFTVGLLGAAGRGGKEIASQLAYGTLDLDQVYMAMSKGMQESFEFFEPGKRMVVGEPTKVSQLVGEVAMAPMSAVMATGQKVAAAEMFKDSPNIRGAAKILGDGLGLMAMGLILHGPSRRAEFSKEAEGIVKEAETLQAREVEISQGANSLVQEVQRKALEIEKQRLESKAAEFSRKFQDDVLLVEDAGRLAEDIAKSKIRPETFSRPEMAEDYVAKPVKMTKREQAKVEKEQRKVEAEKSVEPATKESLQELIEANPELAGKIRVDALGEEGTTLLPGNAQVTILEPGKESSFTAKADIGDIVERYKSKLGEYEVAEKRKGTTVITRKKSGESVKKFKELEEPKVEAEETMSPELLKHLDSMIEESEAPVKSREKVTKLAEKEPEVITEVDKGTGSDVPSEVINDSFMRPLKDAENLDRIFKEREKALSESPEMYVQKLINDVRLWKHGKDVDIKAVRGALSEMGARAGELRHFFDTGVDHIQFMDVAREAAKWAQNTGRIKTGGPRLNVMIPLDQIPDSVRHWYNYTKGMFGKVGSKDVYRNKELWKATGFWYGRDGKWRFELDDSGAKYSPSKTDLDNYKASGYAANALTAVLDHPKLYEQVPKLKDAMIVYDKNLSGKGEYRIESNTVVLKAPHYKNTLFHEIAHGVNREANAFSGGSPGGVLAERFRGVIKDLKNVAKTDEVRREISDVEKSFNKGYIGLNEAAEHIMAIVDRRAPKSADKFAEKLNEILDAGSAFDEYRMIPGEMESRLTERRLNMSKEARMSEPPWQTLDRMLAHEGINPEVGRKLYSGLPVDEAAKAIVAGAKKVAEYTTKARGMKKFKPGAAFQKVREEFVRSAIDRSGNIRKDLIEILGEDGYKVVQKMYLAKGASARSVKELKQMKAEVYEGLSVREKKILDDIILDDRMIDIAKYRGEGEFNFPKGLTPKDFIAHRTLFGEIEGLSKEQVAKLNQRASAYFEWMKKPLKDMLESGLISKEEFDKLASHNYRRIKLVDIFDKRYSTKVGDKKRTVYDSGVEALARGRETDIYEPSSEIMALEVFNRAYGRILNNEANKMLLELAEKDNENPFVRIKSKDRNEKIPSGWNRIFVFDKGERKSLWISPEMGKEWIIRSPEISYKMGQVLRYASGSPVLRTFATGINWGFALANIPRDVMHTWFTARTWKDGEWKPVYSPHAPMFALQMGRDISNVFLDAALRKGRYNDYIDQGGGMEFLVHQGRLLQRGRHVDSKLGDVLDFMGYFGETSEIMTRLAIRDRVIRNEAKKRGISFEEASKNKDITAEATFAARDYMDFGQGGGIAKAADNALPYLNAAIQGTRGIMRSFKPGSGSAFESTYKLAQFGTAVVGTYIAANALAPNTMKELQGNVDMQSNLCIPIGDQFSFEDERGQTRYLYFKIPLDPGQKFFKTMFEGATDKWLGNEVDVNRITGTLNDMSPVGISQLPPTLSATLGYMSNKDFWLNEDIWKETDKPFGFVKSSEEFTGKTPQAYVDVGKVTGLSPERAKYAVEELITNGTIWSYLINQGYDAAFGDISKERKEQHIALALAKFPGFKRFIGVTNPYSKHAQKIDRAAEDTVVKRFVENRGMDMLVEGHLYGNVEREKVFEYARSFKDKDTYDRLIDRFKFEEAIRDLPEKSFWGRMKGLNLEAKARIFVERLNSANEEEKAKLMREYGIVAAAGGVVGKEFRREVSKLMAGE